MVELVPKGMRSHYLTLLNLNYILHINYILLQYSQAAVGFGFVYYTEEKLETETARNVYQDEK